VPRIINSSFQLLLVEEFNLLNYHWHVYLFIIISRLFKVIENEDWSGDAKGDI